VHDLPFFRFLLRISVHPRLPAVPRSWLVTRPFPWFQPSNQSNRSAILPAFSASLRLCARHFSEDNGHGLPWRCRFVSVDTRGLRTHPTTHGLPPTAFICVHQRFLCS
jgi:hypothetical protein